MANQILCGLRDVAWALRFFAARPRLWRWALAPALIAALVMILIAASLFTALGGWVVALGALLPGWLGDAAGWLLKLLLAGVLLVAGYALFLATVAVLTAPFCELLSERVEVELTGRDAPAFSPGILVRDVVLGILHASRRVLAYLVTMGLLFAAGVLIPGLGPVLSAAAGAYVTIRFTAYDALDAVWARKGWSYRAKMDFLRRHRNRAYGVGAAVALLLAIPIVNFIALPTGAVAATRLALETEERDRS